MFPGSALWASLFFGFSAGLQFLLPVLTGFLQRTLSQIPGLTAF